MILKFQGSRKAGSEIKVSDPLVNLNYVQEKLKTTGFAQFTAKWTKGPGEQRNPQARRLGIRGPCAEDRKGAGHPQFHYRGFAHCGCSSGQKKRRKHGPHWRKRGAGVDRGPRVSSAG